MRVRLAVKTTATGSAAASWEIRTGSTPGRWRLMEFGLFIDAATAAEFGLGTPAAIGVTPTTPVDFIVEDPNDVIASGVVQSALAWGTGPTVPGTFDRRISLPATIGSGVIWTWPKGRGIAVSSSIILWNLTAVPVANVYAVLEL